MDEVFKYQEQLTDSLTSANDKIQKVDTEHELDQVIARARDYHEKIINVKRSLMIMKDKTVKLKRRANKILENKNREDIEKQRQKERREIMERHLDPVVNTTRN